MNNPVLLRRIGLSWLTLSLLILLNCTSYQRSLYLYGDAEPDQEIRALWIVRDQIKSRESIRQVIRAMQANGLNTAVVQVRGRGDAFYNSSFVPRADGLEPGLDPLKEFLSLARPAGIQVHAWVNVFLAADTKTIAWNHPAHLIKNRPEWFLKDRKGKSMLDYDGKERKAANVEGAFLDPARPDVRAYNVRVVRELLQNYEFDGLHLDYIRYPWSRSDSQYDFGVFPALSEGSMLTREEQDTLDQQRRDNVTAMVREIREAIVDSRPGIILSAAVWPSDSKIRKHVFQDFPAWIKEGLIDYAFLMAYYNRIDIHDSRMEQFFDPEINKRLVIGIGVFLNPSTEVMEHQLRSSRAISAAGICFFEATHFMDPMLDSKEKPFTQKAFRKQVEPGMTTNHRPPP